MVPLLELHFCGVVVVELQQYCLIYLNLVLPTEMPRRKARANRIFILVTIIATASTLLCYKQFPITGREKNEAEVVGLNSRSSGRSAETCPCARTNLRS